jgi:hypothetical protein
LKRPGFDVFDFEAFDPFVTSIERGRWNMRHDFVPDGFLALTAAGLVLLCSSLLAIAFN